MTEKSTFNEVSNWWALLFGTKTEGHWTHMLKIRELRGSEVFLHPTLLTRQKSKDRMRFTSRLPEHSPEQASMNTYTCGLISQ